MTRTRFMARPRLLPSLLAMALGVSGPALAVPDWNLQPPVTPIARQMYDLHYFIFWICVVIFVAVFGVMFYSIFKHRKSKGAPGGQLPREHDGRDRLDGDPVPDPAVHGLAGDQDRPRDEGHQRRPTSRSRSPATSGSGATTTCRRASASSRTSRRRSRRSRTASRRASTTCSRSTTRWSCRSTRRCASSSPPAT